jgi:hypothetical protein
LKLIMNNLLLYRYIELTDKNSGIVFYLADSSV